MENFIDADYQNIESLYDEAYSYLNKNFCESRLKYTLDGSDMFVINVMNDFDTIKSYAVGYVENNGEIRTAIKNLESCEVFVL